MAKISDDMKSFYFKTANAEHGRCLAPGFSCTETPIRAHSIQNSRVLDLLVRNGHIKGIKRRLSAEKPPEIDFGDIGRNQATTFTGFCAPHDSSIFRSIDNAPFDGDSAEHRFLLAYRSIAREMNSVLFAAISIQSAYKKRVEAGLDPGNAPSPAGLFAVEQMMKAVFLYRYKARFDEALVKSNFDIINSQVFHLEGQAPAIAASSLFSLDGRSKEDEGWVNVALNIFPTSESETLVVFSYLPEDEGVVRSDLQRVFENTGDYQKYELSKLVLNYSDNFVISPAHFANWSEDKVKAIREYFLSTITKGNLDVENKHLYLF